jgi:hypothetical protein
MIAAIFLVLLAAYLAFGLLFAVLFVWFGVKSIDPHARRGTWGFRLLIIPGAAALWPWLLSRWWEGIQESPEECSPHRRAAKSRL